jgi:hypothetical protein
MRCATFSCEIHQPTRLQLSPLCVTSMYTLVIVFVFVLYLPHVLHRHTAASECHREITPIRSDVASMSAANGSMSAEGTSMRARNGRCRAGWRRELMAKSFSCTSQLIWSVFCSSGLAGENCVVCDSCSACCFASCVHVPCGRGAV